jgi:hypothetical protein
MPVRNFPNFNMEMMINVGIMFRSLNIMENSCRPGLKYPFFGFKNKYFTPLIRRKINVNISNNKNTTLSASQLIEHINSFYIYSSF